MAACSSYQFLRLFSHASGSPSRPCRLHPMISTAESAEHRLFVWNLNRSISHTSETTTRKMPCKHAEFSPDIVVRNDLIDRRSSKRPSGSNWLSYDNRPPTVAKSPGQSEGSFSDVDLLTNSHCRLFIPRIDLRLCRLVFRPSYACGCCREHDGSIDRRNDGSRRGSKNP